MGLSSSHPSLDMSLIARLEDLLQAREIARGCVRCSFAVGRTQVVFGEGPARARLMLVGEGAGAHEDRLGRPFAGRAGQLLDRVLGEVGLMRQEVWVTNVVRRRPTRMLGRRRANRPPRAEEIAACRAWMDAELRLVAPRVVVCLGTVAASALLHPGFRLMEERGQWFAGPGGAAALATLHPACVLRQAGRQECDRAWRLPRDDLAMAARVLAETADAAA